MLGSGGNVTIRGAADVLIETADGIPGKIQTSSAQVVAGHVTIEHDGRFRASDIVAWGCGGYVTGGRGGDVTLNGDILGNGAGGPCEVGEVTTYYGRDHYGNGAGDVLITGYDEVHIYGGICTSNRVAPGQSGNRYAGDITITNISGTIIIEGPINANACYGDAYDGDLWLATAPGSHGMIIVSNLNLAEMKVATFDSDRRISNIMGTLSGFTGPYDPTLRAPAGHKIRYERRANPALNEGTFQLYALDGVSDGGELMPIPIGGTVIILQ
jgi:hypothetical protein